MGNCLSCLNPPQPEEEPLLTETYTVPKLDQNLTLITNNLSDKLIDISSFNELPWNYKVVEDEEKLLLIKKVEELDLAVVEACKVSLTEKLYFKFD